RGELAAGLDLGRAQVVDGQLLTAGRRVAGDAERVGAGAGLGAGHGDEAALRDGAGGDDGEGLSGDGLGHERGGWEGWRDGWRLGARLRSAADGLDGRDVVDAFVGLLVGDRLPVDLQLVLVDVVARRRGELDRVAGDAGRFGRGTL